MNGKATNSDIYERIARLETRVDNLGTLLTKLASNDLAHLDKKIDRNSDKIDNIERKLAMATGALAVLQVAVPLIIRVLVD